MVLGFFIGFALDDVLFLQRAVQQVQDPFLVGAPQGRDEVLFCAVAGEPVNDHPGRQGAQTAGNQLAVGL